jgi:hypothetical protein
MNLILLSTHDDPANGTAAMISTQAPGLQNSRDIAPIVADKNGNTLPLHDAMEHNPLIADERVETIVENLYVFQNGEGEKMTKSDKFMWIFTNYGQFKEQVIKRL